MTQSQIIKRFGFVHASPTIDSSNRLERASSAIMAGNEQLIPDASGSVALDY